MKTTRELERRKAFVRGFVKGLAAPMALFAGPAHPAPVKVEITKLHRSIVNPLEAMRSDWVQTGADIDVAIASQKHAD
ncbi:hypothetical protein LGM46_29535 [Burkholderia arboris]|uniref:hypothetical protein n=1 Tax=Burkholderia arboris TaxID=488730 RepID=UPI001CF38999|nr:hypothetical protein [Burkholderia arboris]MCA8037113.1 hypothetical protein [Burkholderia arboris]